MSARTRSAFSVRPFLSDMVWLVFICFDFMAPADRRRIRAAGSVPTPMTDRAPQDVRVVRLPDAELVGETVLWDALGLPLLLGQGAQVDDRRGQRQGELHRLSKLHNVVIC